ncbi:MAG: selenide, water dikinase SelD, partial [Symbiobacteriaceae bacterium]|nr:selenide, water dikinase SelD [Symbiobacteriaceae bacterium]
GNCELRIWADSLPLLPETVAMAAMGFVPAGAYRNREAFADQVAGLSSLNRELADIVCDPQTSGGLLMSIAREKSHLLEQAFKSYGVFFACIGETRESPARVVLCS